MCSRAPHLLDWSPENGEAAAAFRAADGVTLLAFALPAAWHAPTASTLAVHAAEWRAEWLRANAFVLAVTLLAQRLPQTRAYLQPVTKSTAVAHVLWIQLSATGAEFEKAYCRALKCSDARPVQELPSRRAQALRPANVLGNDWANVARAAGVCERVALEKSTTRGKPTDGLAPQEQQDAEKEDPYVVHADVVQFLAQFEWRDGSSAQVRAALEGMDPRALLKEANSGFADASCVACLSGAEDLAPDAFFSTVRLDLQAQLLLGQAAFGPRRAHADPTLPALHQLAPVTEPAPYMEDGVVREVARPACVGVAEWLPPQLLRADAPETAEAAVEFATAAYCTFVEGAAKMSWADRQCYKARAAPPPTGKVFYANLGAGSELLAVCGSHLMRGRHHLAEDVPHVLHAFVVACDAYRVLRVDDVLSQHIAYILQFITRRGGTGKSHIAGSVVICVPSAQYTSRLTAASLQTAALVNGITMVEDDSMPPVDRRQISEATAQLHRILKEIQSRNATSFDYVRFDKDSKERVHCRVELKSVRISRILAGNNPQAGNFDGSNTRRLSTLAIADSAERERRIEDARWAADKQLPAAAGADLRALQAFAHPLVAIVHTVECWLASVPAEFRVDESSAVQLVQRFGACVRPKLAVDISSELLHETLAFAHSLCIASAAYALFFRAGALFAGERFAWERHGLVLLRTLVVQKADVVHALGLTAPLYVPPTVNAVRAGFRALQRTRLWSRAGFASTWPRRPECPTADHGGTYAHVDLEVRLPPGAFLGPEAYRAAVAQLLYAHLRDTEFCEYSAVQLAEVLRSMERHLVRSHPLLPQRPAGLLARLDSRLAGLALAVAPCRACGDASCVFVPLLQVCIAAALGLDVACPNDAAHAALPARFCLRPTLLWDDRGSRGFFPLPPPDAVFSGTVYCHTRTHHNAVHVTAAEWLQHVLEGKRYVPGDCSCAPGGPGVPATSLAPDYADVFFAARCSFTFGEQHGHSYAVLFGAIRDEIARTGAAKVHVCPYHHVPASPAAGEPSGYWHVPLPQWAPLAKFREATTPDERRAHRLAVGAKLLFDYVRSEGALPETFSERVLGLKRFLRFAKDYAPPACATTVEHPALVLEPAAAVRGVVRLKLHRLLLQTPPGGGGGTADVVCAFNEALSACGEAPPTAGAYSRWLFPDSTPQPQQQQQQAPPPPDYQRAVYRPPPFPSRLRAPKHDADVRAVVGRALALGATVPRVSLAELVRLRAGSAAAAATAPEAVLGFDRRTLLAAYRSDTAGELSNAATERSRADATILAAYAASGAHDDAWNDAEVRKVLRARAQFDERTRALLAEGNWQHLLLLLFADHVVNHQLGVWKLQRDGRYEATKQEWQFPRNTAKKAGRNFRVVSGAPVAAAAAAAAAAEPMDAESPPHGSQQRKRKRT